MEVIPFENMEPMEDNSYLSERAIFARDKQIERQLTRKGKRETLLDKYRAAFDLIGGVPRLAIMADENPQDFMAQLIRLETASLAKKVDHSIRVIQPSIPPTALDGEVMDIPFEDIDQQATDGE